MFLGSDFVGGVMAWWRGDRRPSDRGVRREVRELEKLEGGEGEGERRKCPLPTNPTPRCFSCSPLFAPSHNLIVCYPAVFIVDTHRSSA